MESNHPTGGLLRPAGFEDRMSHQTPAAPRAMLERPESDEAQQLKLPHASHATITSRYERSTTLWPPSARSGRL
jgi:hypothetical protein